MSLLDGSLHVHRVLHVVLLVNDRVGAVVMFNVTAHQFHRFRLDVVVGAHGRGGCEAFLVSVGAHTAPSTAAATAPVRRYAAGHVSAGLITTHIGNVLTVGVQIVVVVIVVVV